MKLAIKPLDTSFSRVILIGIHPMINTEEGSALSMVKSYNFADLEYREYFGFTFEEVKDLVRRIAK